MRTIKYTCIIPSTCSQKILPHLRKCIESLRKSSRIAEVQLKVVVVADSRETRNPFNKRIDFFICAGEKPGFAKMNNYAFGKTLKTFESDYFLLINDDAWVEEDFFKEFLKMTKADLIVPLIYEREGPKIDSFGIEYFTSGYAKNAHSFDIKTQLAPAACLFIKTSFLQKMKVIYGFYFNEQLYSYLDDVEFSIRARALGASIEKVKGMVVHHIVSFTAVRKSYYIMYHTYRNILWLIVMTWPLKSILRHIASIALVQGWVGFYSLKTHGPLLYLRVLWDTLLNFAKLIKLRRKIISLYQKAFDFESLFSEYAFRTYHGVIIKV